MMMNRSAFLVMASMVAAAGPATAQDNQVFIEQRGQGNQLTIDQSQALGATVRGLEPINTLDLSGSSNLRSPNQLDISPSDYAVQSGSGNSAEVRMSGAGGTGLLTQQNPLQGIGAAGNSATIDVIGPGLAAIGQFGSGNSASLTTRGQAQGLIQQNGNDNAGSMDVADRLQGTLIQNGNNNNAGMIDVGGIGTSVTVIQNGNNLAPATGQGISVISNAASVTVTQSAFGSGN